MNVTDEDSKDQTKCILKIKAPTQPVSIVHGDDNWW